VTVPWKASGGSPVNGVAAKIDEVRQSLSKEAERLAQMADDYSQQARENAAVVAQDASDQAKVAANVQMTRASGWANDLIKAAASLGTAIALSGRKTAQDLGDTAQVKAKDLRNLRITTDPKKTGPDFTPGITLLAGFGVGIALMYYLDPEHGKARRNLLRDKVMSWSRKAALTAKGTAIDMGNRAQGAIQETRSQIKGQMIAEAETDPNLETQTWRSAGGDGGEYANSSWPEQQPEESISH
jgi:hypothetical protein